jgi:hypothetical protein
LFLKSIFIAAMPFACSDTPHVSGAPFHFAVCHTACSSASFLTAAPVSFTAHLSTAPSLRFIPPRSLFLYCSCAWHPDQHTNQHSRMHTHFRKPTHLAHRVPLHFIPSGFVQYCSVHPLPHFFARRPPLQAAFAVCC